MPANMAGASRPAPMVGNATRPTTIRTTNIATGPMIGMKFRIAASAPSPAGLGMPVTAHIRPVTMPTPTLIVVTIRR